MNSFQNFKWVSGVPTNHLIRRNDRWKNSNAILHNTLKQQMKLFLWLENHQYNLQVPSWSNKMIFKLVHQMASSQVSTKNKLSTIILHNLPTVRKVGSLSIARQKAIKSATNSRLMISKVIAHLTTIDTKQQRLPTAMTPILQDSTDKVTIDKLPFLLTKTSKNWNWDTRNMWRAKTIKIFSETLLKTIIHFVALPLLRSYKTRP